MKKFKAFAALGLTVLCEYHDMPSYRWLTSWVCQAGPPLLGPPQCFSEDFCSSKPLLATPSHSKVPQSVTYFYFMGFDKYNYELSSQYEFEINLKCVFFQLISNRTYICNAVVTIKKILNLFHFCNF